MTSAASRPGLAVLALVIHAALAVALVAASAVPLAALLLALRGPVAFAEDVPSVAWLAPPIAAAALLGARLLAFGRGRRAGVGGTWALLVALGATLLARALDPHGGEHGWTSALDAPPTVQTVAALQQLKEAAVGAVAAGRTVPDDAAWLAAAATDGQRIRPAYLYAGLARRDFHLVRIADAAGPVLEVLPGDLAGTIYAAVSADQKHFWLSAVVLLQENGELRGAMLPGPGGVAVLSNAPRS
jgi:hypothetical protein